MVPFYTPWSYQKIFSFLLFLGGIKREHCPDMGLKLRETESMCHKSVILGKSDKLKPLTLTKLVHTTIESTLNATCNSLN